MHERGMEAGARSPGSFAPATLRMLLAALRGTEGAGLLWAGEETVDGLLEHVLRDRWMAACVEAALIEALGGEVSAGLRTWPYDLAVAWAGRSSARKAAALLWVAARRPEAVYRKLEARFVEDLEQAAALAWMGRPARAGWHSAG